MPRKPKAEQPKPTVVHQDRVELQGNYGEKLVATRNRTTKLTTVIAPEEGVSVSDATILLFAASLVKLTKKKA